LIPIRDENPTRGTPVVVIALIIVNIMVFLIDQLGGTGQRGALAGLAMVPHEVVTGQDIGHPSLQPVWLTLFTSMFMHANILHIGSNMLYLWIFGNNIEDTVGHFMFVLFYLAGGIAASAAHIVSALLATDPRIAMIPTVGASGAIAAVLGAYLILFPRARVICLVFLGFLLTTVAVPALIVLALWFVLQLLGVAQPSPTGGGIAYWAHIGGFVAGVILILLMGGKRLLRGRGRMSYNNNRTYRYD
jgi:membrane associated rhomboid family serine protease